MNFPSMFDLSGKVAVVTGAASGLGVAFCEAMAEAGADVVAADVNEAGNADTVAMVRGLGRRALPVACDITSEASVADLFDRVDAEFGRVDILVNNAGVSDRELAPVHEIELAEWNRVVAVNLTGQFLCARAALRRMVPAKSGKIINIASVQTRLARPGIAPEFGDQLRKILTEADFSMDADAAE